MLRRKPLIIKKDKKEEFIEQLNKNIVSEKFFEECKMAENLFKKNITEKEKLKYLKSKFVKICVNQLPSKDYYKYRHPDLYDLAKEATKNGEKYFYFKKEGHRIIKSKPQYAYQFNSIISEEEFNLLFNIEKRMEK